MYFPKHIKKCGLFLSGGIDSALILYHLSKLPVEVYPIHGYDINIPEMDTLTVAQDVRNWILVNGIMKKDLQAKIHDITIHPMDFVGVKSKYHFMRPARKYLEQRFAVTHWVFGTSQGMPGDERPGNSMKGKELQNLPDNYNDIIVPWAYKNKQDIAKEYAEFNLNELANITNSCIKSTPVPCRECWWCKERYWAFNSYDGGVQ